MAVYKIIYVRKDLDKDKQGRPFCNCHLLVGYNQSSVVDAVQNAEIIKKALPGSNDENISIGHVVKSSWCQGFTMYRWNGHVDLDKVNKEEWRVQDSGPYSPDYFFV